jgi:hypothetical protein
MSVQSRKLASRITSALRNDSVLVTTNVNGEYVYLSDSKGQRFAAVADKGENGFYYFVMDSKGTRQLIRTRFTGVIETIKALDTYPAPKTHKVNASPRIRHTKMTGVSMGRFIPGNLSAIAEA